MAEFAFVMLIFMLIVLGVIDLSRAVYARNVVASVAREGARYAVMHSDPLNDQDIERYAKQLVAGLDGRLVHVHASKPDSSHVQVDVTYTFYPVSLWIARYVDGGSGSGLPLRGRSVMRTE